MGKSLTFFTVYLQGQLCMEIISRNKKALSLETLKYCRKKDMELQCPVSGQRRTEKNPPH
jgi:hypothetical protein